MLGTTYAHSWTYTMLFEREKTDVSRPDQGYATSAVSVDSPVKRSEE